MHVWLRGSSNAGKRKIKERLEPFGYNPEKLSPNIWYHDTQLAKFILCVDNFVLRYYLKEDAERLKTVL